MSYPTKNTAYPDDMFMVVSKIVFPDFSRFPGQKLGKFPDFFYAGIYYTFYY